MPTASIIRDDTRFASTPRDMPPVHPGEVLGEEFLQPLGLTARALALAIRVPANRITEIVRGRRGISADTALRLARYFGTSTAFWLNLQSGYDLQVALSEMDHDVLDQIAPHHEAA